jgi:hypothetical protein
MIRPNPTSKAGTGALLMVLATSLWACDTATAPEIDPPHAVVAASPGSVGAAMLADAAPIVATIRRSTEKYHRAEVAVDEGFAAASGCVAVPGLGGMGLHYADMSRLGDAEVDPSRPEVILYEPSAHGLRMVGVEFLVVADAWDVAHAEPPALLGVEFDEHRGADTHGLPFDHYELHVWSWRHNPSGLTAPFNPKVSCDGA